MQARRAAYLSYSALGSSEYSQLAKLELGLPVDPAVLTAQLDFVDSRKDTADFHVATLLRILYRHGQSPALPPNAGAWLFHGSSLADKRTYLITELSPKIGSA